MKVNGPAYEIECSSVNDSIVFLPPGDEKRFSIRLFLKGAAMNRASGVPGRSRELLLGAFPRKGPLVAPQQVHGTDVIAASTGQPFRPGPALTEFVSTGAALRLLFGLQTVFRWLSLPFPLLPGSFSFIPDTRVPCRILRAGPPVPFWGRRALNLRKPGPGLVRESERNIISEKKTNPGRSVELSPFPGTVCRKTGMTSFSTWAAKSGDSLKVPGLLMR